MLLTELLHRAGYKMPDGIEDRAITAVSASSDQITEGSVFVAIRGLHSDGHDYIKDAVKKGAALLVCERKVQTWPCLVVPNTREAWAKLTDAWYENPTFGMKLIGITGTNGKTSTATILFDILRRAGYSCGLIGTVSCMINEEAVHLPNADSLANMTTPDPPQLYAMLRRMRDRGVTHVVMEVTSHALALSKVAPLTFERAVFTNLTPDHLDLHGDMEHYFAEKKKLFLKAHGAVISCLSDYGARLAESLTIPAWRLSTSNLQSKHLMGEQGSSFILLEEEGNEISIFLPVAGNFMIENAALAALAARSLGVEAQVIADALRTFSGVRGRMERVGEKSDVAVFLDYAHTPDALESVLQTVRGFCLAKQRILLVFGCGGDRDRSKRAEMGRIASRLADYVIVTSDNCRSEQPEGIIADIMKGIDKERPYRIVADRRAAIREAILSARSGDVVLLAGKGHEEYEICGDVRLYFNERDIVLEALKMRREEQ